jgi:hypothetical protein
VGLSPTGKHRLCTAHATTGHSVTNKNGGSSQRRLPPIWRTKLLSFWQFRSLQNRSFTSFLNRMNHHIALSSRRLNPF